MQLYTYNYVSHKACETIDLDSSIKKQVSSIRNGLI